MFELTVPDLYLYYLQPPGHQTWEPPISAGSDAC